MFTAASRCECLGAEVIMRQAGDQTASSAASSRAPVPDCDWRRVRALVLFELTATCYW